MSAGRGNGERERERPGGAGGHPQGEGTVRETRQSRRASAGRGNRERESTKDNKSLLDQISIPHVGGSVSMWFSL